ncbi:phosphoglycerate dehydrogenase [Sulfurisphaera ohwakuensis]|uniref:phosphoglycerate dehydrogenase n=1 Tax=Sulfurisphaera ohwakuensis TaxID=69656 RepID=UPI0036F194A8
MQKYKILITSPWFTEGNLSILRKYFDVKTNSLQRWLTENELQDIISDYDAVIAGLDPFTKKVIEKAKKLKIIARRGIGYDNIDVEYACSHGIYVTNSPVAEEHEAVAEFTIGLILLSVRNLYNAHESLKNRSWNRETFLGRNLKSMVIGILGLGNIGKKVATLLSAFGSKIIYYDPYVYDPRFEKVDLYTLFKLSDIITIHMPLNNETQGIINKELLGIMKTGSYIINTSRAEIINKNDLLWAIDSGIIKYVALDVFYNEPPDLNDELLKRKNVFLTPHIAAYTLEAFNAIDKVCVNNIIKVLLYNEKPEYLICK